MKKLILALAFVGFSANLMAQENEIPSQKYSVATNSFWSNWYIQVGGDFNAAYSNQENLGNKNPFSVDRGTFGFDVAIGKWFTPVIGLRTKFQGMWAKSVVDANNHHSFSYWNIHEDVMFNLSNLFCGYNETRVWNIAPYVGLGYISRIDGGKGRNVSLGSHNLSYHFGLYNSFRINSRLAAFLDVWAMATPGEIDGKNGPVGSKYDYANRGEGSLRHWDKLVGVSVGLNINRGKARG